MDPVIEDESQPLELRLPPQKLDAIHCALLSGLLSNIGQRGTGHEYNGARGTKFSIFPGSSLFKRKPSWVMASELVETTRLYARTVATIQPQWIERIAPHLVKREYSEPRWQMQSAHVAAFEKVSLYGLTIVPRRTVHYGPINPEASRQLFIYHAFVLGEFRSKAEFFLNNQQLIADIRTLEAKRRQRDLLVDDETIYDFYDKRIPRDVFSGTLLERWRLQAERGRPTLLFMQRRDLMRREVEDNKHDYPDFLEVSGLQLPLEYIFDSSNPNDGVTLTIPLAALNQLPSEPFEWLVPGLLREKVITLMKGMPKALRVRFVPIPESASEVMNHLGAAERSLYDALATRLGKISGEPIDGNAFNPLDLPAYLQMNFRIVDDANNVVLVGRDLEKLRRDLGIQARKTFQKQPPSEFHRDNVGSWDFGDLPDRVEVRRNGMTLQGYPALVDAGQMVSLRLFDSEAAARQSMREGVRRLLMIQLREEVKWLSRKLPGFERMCLHYKTIGDCEQLKVDLIDAITDRALFGEEAEVRTRQQFLDRAQIGWKRLSVAANEIGELVVAILKKHHELELELSQVAPPALMPSYQDMRRHLARLIYDGFVIRTPPASLTHYPRYLAGLESRLRKLLNAGLARDVAGMQEINPLQKQFDDRAAKHAREGISDPELQTFRWMLEELRISLYAQELKTAVPVSPKRLESQWAKVKP